MAATHIPNMENKYDGYPPPCQTVQICGDIPAGRCEGWCKRSRQGSIELNPAPYITVCKNIYCYGWNCQGCMGHPKTGIRSHWSHILSVPIKGTLHNAHVGGGQLGHTRTAHPQHLSRFENRWRRPQWRQFYYGITNVPATIMGQLHIQYWHLRNWFNRQSEKAWINWCCPGMHQNWMGVVETKKQFICNPRCIQFIWISEIESL